MQEWFDVPGYPGYQVTKAGNVKGMRGPVKGSLNKGYIVGSIRLKGQRVGIGHHRLVALAFCEKPEGKEFVNHINGIRNDNRAENLEWVDKGENVVHGIQVLGRVNTVLSGPEVRKIREWHAAGFTPREIARVLKRERGTIYDAINRTWQFID